MMIAMFLLTGKLLKDSCARAVFPVKYFLSLAAIISCRASWVMDIPAVMSLAAPMRWCGFPMTSRKKTGC